MFVTAWVFEARHCPTLLNEIMKTKLQTNTEPQAGINILCVPSMGIWYRRYQIIPEGESPLCAGVTPRSISKSQGGLL
jgi:hypothetical protein